MLLYAQVHDADRAALLRHYGALIDIAGRPPAEWSAAGRRPGSSWGGRRGRPNPSLRATGGPVEVLVTGAISSRT